MKEELKKYIDLLFAGAQNAEDIKQEILQNTLDRYDDLIAQGKTPEAAYRLAISGIGDVSELLAAPASADGKCNRAQEPTSAKPLWKKTVKAVAIFLYIICAIPLFVLGDMNMETIGLCGTICIAAVATALLIISSADDKANPRQTPSAEEAGTAVDRPKKLSAAASGMCWLVGVVLYFIISFATSAWYITWLIFCMIPCVTGAANGILNLRTRTAGSIVKIILLSLLLLILVAMMVTGIIGGSLSIGFFGFDGLPGGTEARSGTVDAASVNSIELRWVSGSITVQTADVDSITFQEDPASSSAPKLAWKQDGDTLIIAFLKQSTWQFGMTTNSIGKDLVITVPKDWLADSISIDSVSAKISLDSISAQEFELQTVSGNCDFTQCSIESLETETVSGNIDYEGTISSFSAEAVSADCDLRISNYPERIELDAVSGDMTVYLPADCGFTVTTDSVSGDFSTDFAATSKKGRYTFGNGECQITADSVSGDIRVYAN